jgi:hypothetical protein
MTPAMTAAEVAAFQKLHLNHLGQPLKVDGALGPQTQWVLDLGTLCAERRITIREAQGYIGLAESPPGSNDDPRRVIRGWLERCGARPGDPWCASFLSHCLRTVRIAGALNLGAHFPETRIPLAGDIFTYPTGPDPRQGHGHCGLVTGVAALELMTIEGNCANAVRCVRRERGVSTSLRFWRVFSDASGTCPGIPPNVPYAPGLTV